MARHVRVPEMTLLFAVFGALSVCGEALGLASAGRPYAVRAAANLACLGAGWGLTWGLLVPLVVRTGLFSL
jgi:hypothetical protein